MRKLMELVRQRTARPAPADHAPLLARRDRGRLRSVRKPAGRRRQGRARAVTEKSTRWRERTKELCFEPYEQTARRRRRRRRSGHRDTRWRCAIWPGTGWRSRSLRPSASSCIGHSRSPDRFDLGETPRFKLSAVARDLDARRTARMRSSPSRPATRVALTRSGASVPVRRPRYYERRGAARGDSRCIHVPWRRGQRTPEDADRRIPGRRGGRSIVFAVPSGTTWPLPIYELALITAARIHSHDSDAVVKLVTPEASPMASSATRQARPLRFCSPRVRWRC